VLWWKFSVRMQNKKDPALKKCSGLFIRKGSSQLLAVFIVEQVALNRHVQNFQIGRF
jgi:hypothetical protein